ncbi:hypothetical protein SLEP1_g57917, partial [Rubroshorea leprosula]
HIRRVQQNEGGWPIIIGKKSTMNKF